jgi:hypothetical protein
MNHCSPSLSWSSSIWAFNALMRRFTGIANKTPSFCWILEVEVFSGWLKEVGRFPASPSSRPPRTRFSPCGDDVRAGTLSVALRRLFLRPFHLITNSRVRAPIYNKRFPSSARRRRASCIYIMMMATRRRHLTPSICFSLFANRRQMTQYVVCSFLLSRINEDAPLASKRSGGSGMDSSRAG